MMISKSDIRFYYRYADYSYTCWRDSKKGPILPQPQFPFPLYASGEYAKLLEEEWKETPE